MDLIETRWQQKTPNPFEEWGFQALSDHMGLRFGGGGGSRTHGMGDDIP